VAWAGGGGQGLGVRGEVLGTGRSVQGSIANRQSEIGNPEGALGSARGSCDFPPSRSALPACHSALATRHWVIGRWLSPDPLGGDVTNPQSQNRYADVLNNPTSSVDPLGLSNRNVFNVSWEGSGTPFPCGLENNPSGPPPVTMTNGADLSSDLAQAEAGWNQTMAQQFITQCANSGNCQATSQGGLTINGISFAWVPGP
jgi:uncharacterized protein RhaS with RHS repeats